jgi:hypothetical protein
MKYSFIKDLNGLEIVIMYISAIRSTQSAPQTHGKRTRGVFWYVNCTLEILKTRVEKQMLKFDSNRLGEI